MSGRLRILVVGGYGTFGGRIIDLLQDEPLLTLIVAGRSGKVAEDFCRARTHARAQLIPAAFDRSQQVEPQLCALSPDILIDASGPFQAYGDDQYNVIRSCLKRRVHYFDLADGSDFVAGVKAFDIEARDAGIYVLSGMSSFPVLTAAVVRRLSVGLAHVTAIRGGIAPSPYAGVGANVIRAIATYAGQRVRLKRQGHRAVGRPFTEHMRFAIAPPGRLPLRSRIFSLVDVPDLRVLTESRPDAKTVWMGAAPVPEVLHRALIGCAWLVRLGVLPSLSPLAPLMHFASNHLRWGEHRGGMFVAIEGVDGSGRVLERSWHLLAEGDDGPLIPSMAIAALVRKLLKGRSPPPGARAGTRDVELADYEELFAERTIHTGTREYPTPEGQPLYAKILGSTWPALPEQIRTLHDFKSETTWEGRASVKRGRGIVARLVATLVGFPRGSADTRVLVRFEMRLDEEIWTRTFGKDSFSSRQFAGRGRSENLLCERFGPLTFAMALLQEGERLSLVLRRWSFLGIPLPMWLCPRSDSHESVEGGLFNFHVSINHPLMGLIVQYHGWLRQDRQPDLTALVAETPQGSA